MNGFIILKVLSILLSLIAPLIIIIVIIICVSKSLKNKQINFIKSPEEIKNCFLQLPQPQQNCILSRLNYSEKNQFISYINGNNPYLHNNGYLLSKLTKLIFPYVPNWNNLQQNSNKKQMHYQNINNTQYQQANQPNYNQQNYNKQNINSQFNAQSSYENTNNIDNNH